MAQPTKKPTNLSLDQALLSEARAYGVNLSQAAEQGVSEALRQAKEARWLKDNANALKSSNEFVEAHGLPLDAFRQF